MASLKDVAAIAGVSPSTVSYVINGKKVVRPETMRRIEEAIRAVDYHPNLAARSLKTRKSKSAGIVIPNLSNIFFIDILSGIEEALTQAGYSTIIANSRNIPELEEQNLKLMARRNIDGLIWMGMGISRNEILRDMKIPVVCADNIDASASFTVSINNRMGGYLGAKHLLDKGHKKITFIGYDQQSSEQSRLQGCLDAYAEAGIDAQDNFNHLLTSISPAGGYEAMDKLLRDNDVSTIDAVFASADTIAFGVIKAITDYGFSVPKHIAVVGFDNLMLSKFFVPALTTVSQPKHEIGLRSAKMLLDLISQKNVESKVELSPKLVIRDST